MENTRLGGEKYSGGKVKVQWKESFMFMSESVRYRNGLNEKKTDHVPDPCSIKVQYDGIHPSIIVIVVNSASRTL